MEQIGYKMSKGTIIPTILLMVTEHDDIVRSMYTVLPLPFCLDQRQSEAIDLLTPRFDRGEDVLVV